MSAPLPQPLGRQPGVDAAKQVGFWADLGSGLVDGLFEILVWVVAVAVVVGGFGALGYLVGGGVGVAVGAVVGAGVLGVIWLLLVATGASIAVRKLRRGRRPGA